MAADRRKILVVDDDRILAESLGAFLERSGYEVTPCEGVVEARRALEAQPGFAVLISDVALGGDSGLDLLRWTRKEHPDVVPIVITGYGTIEMAVEAIRHGAIDFLTKPLVDEELALAVAKAEQQHVLFSENARLRAELDARDGFDNIVGADPRMLHVYETVRSVAPSRTTVLMAGESGTGKSLLARAIHRSSNRSDGPFIELACGSVPETLLESELFGHVKGAFTGAHADKTGRFLAANGGTIFLDEINSASPAMQLKLLRVLQERTFEPVGSSDAIETDVRVILATNQPLEDLVARGEFRQDLYYRINVVAIDLPPLRERVSDIPLLAAQFLTTKASEAERAVDAFSPDAMAALEAYVFPGNVRELENIVERAVVLTRDRTIGVADLPPHVVEGRTQGLLPVGALAIGEGGDEDVLPLKTALEREETRLLRRALEANEWNRQRTADALEINRTTLYKKMRDYGLDRP